MENITELKGKGHLDFIVSMTPAEYCLLVEMPTKKDTWKIIRNAMEDGRLQFCLGAIEPDEYTNNRRLFSVDELNSAQITLQKENAPVISMSHISDDTEGFLREYAKKTERAGILRYGFAVNENKDGGLTVFILRKKGDEVPEDVPDDIMKIIKIAEVLGIEKIVLSDNGGTVSLLPTFSRRDRSGFDF